METRKSFRKRYIRNIALYASETWTVGTEGRIRLEALEIWSYRKLLKIRWIDKNSNDEILTNVGKQ